MNIIKNILKKLSLTGINNTKDGKLSDKYIRKTRRKLLTSIQDIFEEQKKTWENEHGSPNFSYLLIKYKNPHLFTKKERFNKIYKEEKISKVFFWNILESPNLDTTNGSMARKCMESMMKKY